jgi:hypothetical protein
VSSHGASPCAKKYFAHGYPGLQKQRTIVDAIHSHPIVGSHVAFDTQ